MIPYLMLAAGNLVACLIIIEWLNTAFSDYLYLTAAVLGIYLTLGPILFLIPFNRWHLWRRPLTWIPTYLIALILLGITVAFSLEFHQQLVKIRIPLVVLDPPQMTLFFLGYYLPTALLLCLILSRLARGRPKVLKPALLNPGHGIPVAALSAQTTVEPHAASPVGPIPESNSDAISTISRNELTFNGSNAINNRLEEEEPARRDPMDTIEPARLKQILDQFAALTNLSLLAYDARGHLLSEPSLENPICRAVQTTAKGQRHCKSHCGRSIGLALQGDAPLFFKCDMNLHVFSIPIRLDEKTRLVLQGGKSFLNAQEFADSQNTAVQLDVPIETLIPLGGAIRVKENSFMVNTARFLETMLPYLLSSIHEKNTVDNKFSRLMTLFTMTADLKNDPSQLLHTLLNTLGVLFNLNTASVLLRDPKQSIFKTAVAFGQKIDLIRDYQTDGSSSLMKAVLDQHAPVSTPETFEILRAGFPAGFTSIHLFPLFTRNHQTTSLLCIFDTVLNEEEARLISTFCQQISLIQENARLHQERHDMAKDVSILLEISKTVGSALDSEDLFSIILEKSTQFVQAEQGSLMLLDEDRHELTIRAMKGLNKKIVELLKIRPGEGISGKVLSTGVPLVVADIESDLRVAQEKRPRYKTKSFISIPLKLNDRIIGVLNVADKITGEVFSEADLQLLTSIGAYATVAIERSKYYQKTEELKKISITDLLTGLLNRRYFQERVSEEMERSRRHHLPLSLIMIDVDNFKSVNDGFGHLAGDEVLKTVARCIRNSVRTIDVAARYGGEEFTVILPQTNKDDAQTIAERICTEVRHLDFPFTKSGQKLLLSVSLGLATYPEDADNLEDLIRNADIALYAAKSQGKNRVVIYGAQ